MYCLGGEIDPPCTEHSERRPRGNFEEQAMDDGEVGTEQSSEMRLSALTAGEATVFGRLPHRFGRT